MLTHGFTLDEQGRKMSKSLGNITAPQVVCDQYGADILRLWVVGTDYTEDQRIGPEILKHQAEAYRRLRNTLRYLLGSLDGYSAAEKVGYAEHAGARALGAASPGRARCGVAPGGRRLRLPHASRPSCTISAPSISRPSTSTSARTRSTATRPKTLRRRAARTVMAELFSFLTAWLAPITCFTAEEAWLMRPSDVPDGAAESVHLRLYPDDPRRPGSMRRWARSGRPCATLRRVVTGALELERAEKRIGSSLQAAPHVHVAPEYLAAMKGLDLAEICITSGGDLVEGDGAGRRLHACPTSPASPSCRRWPTGDKCARCWQVLEEVGKSARHPLICQRCEGAVESLA